MSILPCSDKQPSFKRSAKDLDKRESTLEGRACRYAESLGYWHRKFKSPGKRSAPDRIFKHPYGPAIAIEFKACGESATELQKLEHDEMRAAGWLVYVIDRFEDAKQVLDRHCL